MDGENQSLSRLLMQLIDQHLEQFKAQEWQSDVPADPARKSIGTLVDELFTVSMKCWFAQEVIVHSSDDATVAEAARKAQQLNARRNALMRAIDAYFGDANALSAKTYLQGDA